MLKMIATAVLLASAVSGCNNPPAPQAVSHPPVLDLTCPAEPAALTDEHAASDQGGVLEQAFNDAVMIAGRACRDSLARVCRWHVQRGLDGVTCAPVATRERDRTGGPN